MNLAVGFWLESVVYRACGLPLALRRWSGTPMAGLPADRQCVRDCYLDTFASPLSGADLAAYVVAAIIWPLAIPMAAGWLTLRNGAAIRRRSGKGAWRQFAEQLQLAWREGVLPPWYYIFELHEPGRREKAGLFLTRWESKRGVYPAMRGRGPVAPLRDKARFAAHCAAHGVRAAPVLAEIRKGSTTFTDARRTLPDADLFVKPAAGRGGVGAERWTCVGPGRYRGPGVVTVDAADLLKRLEVRSRRRDLLIQPRLTSHRDLADLACGALATVRILTCLDEDGRPEVTDAVFRMAAVEGSPVDNFHAGGIAAPVDLASGRLAAATDLGMDARRGWVERHPVTGAAITGRILPFWAEAQDLARQAHRAFSEHLVIGWDVGLLDDGPCIVEGNGGPDLDLMQRPARQPMGGRRFSQLCAFHLDRRRRQMSEGAPAWTAG
jgi:hypothetical protein